MPTPKTARERFFAYARERHAIFLRRAEGAPEPWTTDPILTQYRFTNVFRELDKTTAWFRRRVRDPLCGLPEVLLATVLFRMLNRIEIGEALFIQMPMTDAGDLHSAFEKYLKDGYLGHLRQAARAFAPRGPYVTGAYIISTPPGCSKLEGVLKIVDSFAQGQQPWPSTNVPVNWRVLGQEMATHRMSLEETWHWLSQFDYLGKFHSYEIVTDLRFTHLLDRAPDIDTWANMGPGAKRGLNRIAERERPGGGREAWGGKIEDPLAEMRELLALSRSDKFWPQLTQGTYHLGGRKFSGPAKVSVNTGIRRAWPRWEMRDVEHTLCEFDKYERVRLGEGRPRGRFR